MAEALDLNLRGLIHVLADVLIREVEREMAEASKETESESEDAVRNFVEQMEQETNA